MSGGVGFWMVSTRCKKAFTFTCNTVSHYALSHKVEVGDVVTSYCVGCKDFTEQVVEHVTCLTVDEYRKQVSRSRMKK